MTNSADILMTCLTEIVYSSAAPAGLRQDAIMQQHGIVSVSLLMIMNAARFQLLFAEQETVHKRSPKIQRSHVD
jgi:hypothetical protein